MNQETYSFRDGLQIIEITDSSLLKRIIYDYPSEELTVQFKKYYTEEITYVDVPSILFEEMVLNRKNSYGKFYLQQIKLNFKQKTKQMSTTQPEGVNIASDKKRFIKVRLDVSKINKDWLFEGKNGVYLDCTLQMLPDGETDKFGNLGMITQDVPKDVYTKEKDLAKADKSQGAILGNGKEILWSGGSAEGAVGAELGKASQDALDDLPF